MGPVRAAQRRWIERPNMDAGFPIPRPCHQRALERTEGRWGDRAHRLRPVHQGEADEARRAMRLSAAILPRSSARRRCTRAVRPPRRAPGPGARQLSRAGSGSRTCRPRRRAVPKHPGPGERTDPLARERPNSWPIGMSPVKDRSALSAAPIYCLLETRIQHVLHHHCRARQQQAGHHRFLPLRQDRRQVLAGAPDLGRAHSVQSGAGPGRQGEGSGRTPVRPISPCCTSIRTSRIPFPAAGPGPPASHPRAAAARPRGARPNVDPRSVLGSTSNPLVT